MAAHHKAKQTVHLQSAQILKLNDVAMLVGGQRDALREESLERYVKAQHNAALLYQQAAQVMQVIARAFPKGKRGTWGSTVEK